MWLRLEAEEVLHATEVLCAFPLRCNTTRGRRCPILDDALKKVIQEDYGSKRSKAAMQLIRTLEQTVRIGNLQNRDKLFLFTFLGGAVLSGSLFTRDEAGEFSMQ